MSDSKEINELLAKIKKLEQENAMLKSDFPLVPKGDTVSVPEGIKPLFDEAQKTVGEYFRNFKMDPTATAVAEKKSKSEKTPEIIKDCLLLVEDNMINQRLTKLILEKAGFEVITANNGQEAVDYYKTAEEIKLVIMDIQMPILDGLAATQIIRFHEVEQKLKRSPIIALTAHAMKGDKEKCLAAGCDDYLSKPIMLEVLVNTIKKYI